MPISKPYTCSSICELHCIDLCVLLLFLSFLCALQLVALAPCNRLAVLQPITSLVATLSLIKPHYYPKLLDKLTQSPSLNAHHTLCQHASPEGGGISANETTSAFTNTRAEDKESEVKVSTNDSLTEEAALHGTQVAGGSVLRDTEQEGDNSAHRDKFVARYASDPELYMSLQLLFCSSRTGSQNDSGKCS